MCICILKGVCDKKVDDAVWAVLLKQSVEKPDSSALPI